jgi:AraC family transcriptional regulator of adaptative response / DNA-3-methyladenine glycosylase II
VEVVDAATYRRTIVLDGKSGVIEVSRLDTGTALGLEVRFPDPRALLTIVERVRRIFDLVADPAIIAQHLRADPLLARAIARVPGVRTPGAWDGFELSVRAILGQQVSVSAATTVAGRVAALFGSPVAGDRGVSRLFPTPAQLVSAPIERAGVMPARAETIRALAHAVMSGAIDLSWSADSRVVVAALVALPGIGRWTAEYIAMRALGEPDAWPTGDLVLRRVAGDLSARDLDRRADAWRPWRAYAVMLLWQTAAAEDAHSRRKKRHAHQADRPTRARRPARAGAVAAARRTG